MNDIQINFISNEPERASSYMRGRVVSDHLKKFGVGSCFRSDSGHGKENEVFVYIKNYGKASNKNGLSVYDPIDNFNLGKVAINSFDYIIASNEKHKSYIEKYTSKKNVVIIDHLHTNTKRKRKEQIELKNVGYVGVKSEFSLHKEMPSVCSENGLSWVYMDPHSKWSYNEDTLASNAMKLDLGVIFFNSSLNGYDTRINYKPSNKLTFLFSFGIPVLHVPHVSYNKVIEPFEDLKFLLVNSYDEVKQKIKFLKENKEFYQKMSNLAFEAAELYHMDKAYDKYYLQFSELLKNKHKKG